MLWDYQYGQDRLIELRAKASWWGKRGLSDALDANVLGEDECARILHDQKLARSTSSPILVEEATIVLLKGFFFERRVTEGLRPLTVLSVRCLVISSRRWCDFLPFHSEVGEEA